MEFRVFKKAINFPELSNLCLGNRLGGIPEDSERSPTSVVKVTKNSCIHLSSITDAILSKCMIS